MDELGVDIVSFKFLAGCLLEYGYSIEELIELLYEAASETYH